jgi:hypothetical protein
MPVLIIDLAGVDWLYIAELYGLIFFFVTLALMFAASLVFWAHYRDDQSTA